MLADREVALAGELAMVDGLVDHVGHVLGAAVAQLDPADVPRGDPPDLLGGDPELPEVPRVDGQPPVRRVRALDERERGLEVVDVHVGRHELVDDERIVVLGRVRAELGVALDQPVELTRRPGDVPGLDVVRPERGRRLPEEGPDPVGLLPALVGLVEEPVHRELELEVAEPVIVEQLLHLGERPALEHVLEVCVP